MLTLNNCVIRSPGIVEPMPDVAEHTGGTGPSGYTAMMLSDSTQDKGAMFWCASGTTSGGLRASGAKSTEVTYADPTTATKTFKAWHDDSNRGGGSNSWRFMRPYQARKNLYMADERGLIKITSVDESGNVGDVETVWEPRIDCLPGTSGAGSTLANNEHVGYRAVVLWEDANGLVRRSRPSAMRIFDNTSGLARDAQVIVRVGLHTYSNTSLRAVEIYRTRIFANTVALSPSEMYLVHTMVASDLTTASTTFQSSAAWVDSVPDDALGKLLYTYLEPPNWAPPNPLHSSTWNGYTFWGNATTPAVWALRTKETIAQVTKNSCTLNTGSPVITVPTNTDIELGMMVDTSTSQFPAGTYVTTISGTSITVSENSLVTDAGGATVNFDPAALIRYADGEIDRFPLRGRRFWDQYSSNLYTCLLSGRGTLYGDPDSDYTQDLVIGSVHKPGRMVDSIPSSLWINNPDDWESDAELADLGGNAAHFGNPASLEITNGTKAQREVEGAGLWISKLGEPEHCSSLGPWSVIGDPGKDIVGLAPLRDALIIFKLDGVYRLTGSNPTNFRVDPIDTTIRALGGQTVHTLHNRAYSLADTGIIAVDGATVHQISRGVVNDWFREISVDLSNPRMERTLRHLADYGFVPDGSVFAGANEATGEYVLMCVGDSAHDTGGYDDQLLVYNAHTDSFYTWEIKPDFGAGISTLATFHGAPVASSQQSPTIAFGTYVAGTPRIYYYKEQQDSRPHEDFTQELRLRALDAGDATATKFWRQVTWNLRYASDINGRTLGWSSTPDGTVSAATFEAHEWNNDAEHELYPGTDQEMRMWVPRGCARSSELVIGLRGQGLHVRSVSVIVNKAGDTAPMAND